MHYYKFNIHDWQASTRHLTPEEEGVYFRLINYYYDTENPIPLETQPVIRRLILGSHSDIVDQILAEFFTKTDKGYEKQKCNEVLSDYRKTSKKNKKNGIMGGRPRKHVASEETQNKPSGFKDETQNEPKHNPNQEPLTTNQEPLTNSHNNNDNKKDIDVLFDSFWASGIRKAAKKQAKIVFTKLLASKQQKQEFTDYLIRDIQWRLTNCQKGFEELHPTTYLRNERWTDERRGQQQIKPNGSKLSLAGKSEEQTKILQARIAAGDFDQRPLGSDDATISTQVGFGGRGQDGSSPAVDGEFYTLVPENGRVDG